MLDPIRIAIVEDHSLTRAGLSRALMDAGFSVVAECADGLSGWEQIQQLVPDIAVLDIGLPGIDGIELTRKIRQAGLQTRVVILTMHDVEGEVFGALAAGADAYCVKSGDPSGVITAVRTAMEGGAYFDPAVAHIVLSQFGISAASRRTDSSPLTPRETEIVRLIADGLSNVEIAGRLALGLGTVKGHIRDILEKLSVADRTQAAVLALRRGLI
jgi:two-component system, NarL family, response regulator LiaR